MSQSNVSGRVNWKALGILIAVAIVLAGGATAGHYIHKRVAAAHALQQGQAAYARQDWPAAARFLWQYLQFYPENPDILARYASAQSQVRPLDGDAIQGIIAAYRRLVRFQPDNEEAYDGLARLYAGIRDTDNLAYVARLRLVREPYDLKASVWLGHALAVQHKPDQVREVLLPAVSKWAQVSQRYPEYIDACSLLSEVAVQADAPGAANEARRWLDRAVEYDPKAPEALINRARFVRTLAAQPRQDRQALLASVHVDLEHADSLQPADPRQRLILSDEWMRLGQFDRAAAELDAIRDLKTQTVARYFLDPTDWQIALYLQSAELALRSGRADDALQKTDRVLADLKDKGRRLPTLPTAVRAYLAAGRVSDAERCLREYQENKHLDISPGASEDAAGLLEAIVVRAQDRPYRVIELLEPIASRNPNNPAAWRLLAEAYAQTDQGRRSIRAIRQYLAQQPDDAEMTRMLMRNYVLQQDWSRAAAAARTLELLDPNDLEATLFRIEDAINRAVAEASAGRADRLRPVSEELDALAREHPQQTDVWILRAAVAANLGDLDLAERELRQAQASGLDPLSVQLQRAHLYLGIRQPDKALASLEEACRLAPQTQPTSSDQVTAWLERADLQRTRGQVDQARQTLRSALQAISTPAGKSQIQAKLAVLEILQGDHRAGIDILRSLATQDPRNIHVRTMLLAVPDVQQDAAESGRLIEEIRQVEGPRGLTWRLWQASTHLADANWRSHQQEIEVDLQRCIDADPGWAVPASLLAGVQERVGNFDRAEAIYRNVLAADPGALEIADRLLDLLQRHGRLSQASDVLKGLDTTDIALSSRRTLIAMETGHVDQAIDELKVRTSHDPRDVQSRVLLAQLVYRQTRDATQALRYLDEAEAISPGTIAVTMGRVIILNTEGRRQDAVEQLDILVKQKNSFESHQLRGSYLASIGQTDRAEQDYAALADLPGDGTGHQVLGLFYAQTQRLDQAIATWRDGLARHADNLALQRSLMKGLLQRGGPAETAEAVRILCDLESRMPKDPELLTIRAGLLLTEHSDASMARAETLFEQATQIAPTCIDAHCGLISITLQRHDYAAARKRAVFALGIDSSDTRLLVLRAQAELGLSNYVMAHDLAGIALKDKPHDAEARNVLVQAAVASRNPRDIENALALVCGELARNPADLHLQLTNALLLSSLGRTDQAIQAIRDYTASPEGSQSVEAIVSLADLYQSKGEMSPAEELLRQAADLQPRSPAVLRGTVNFLAAGKQYDRIVQMMDEYASTSTADAGVLEAAAEVLAASPDKVRNEQALRFFHAAIQVAADPLPARIGYASLAYRLGHVDDAETMYRRVLQTDPSSVQALNDLAWLLCKDRDLDEQALELADRAAHLSPDNIHVRDTRGEILASLPGRLTDARREFETCVDLADPDSADRTRALVRLGRVLCKLENSAQARVKFDEARRIDRQRNVLSQAERDEMEQMTKALPGQTRSEPVTLQR